MAESNSESVAPWEPCEIAELFERQLKHLEDLGVSWPIRRALQSRMIKYGMSDGYLAGGFPRSRVPVIPVIPPFYYGIYGLLAFLHREAYVDLDPCAIEPFMETPKEPYLLLDVDDSREVQGMSWDEGHDFICNPKRGRCKMTTHEVLAVALHTNILAGMIGKDHDMHNQPEGIYPGDWYRGVECNIIRLKMYTGLLRIHAGVPHLTAMLIDNEHPHSVVRRTPTCRGRF